MKSFSVSRIREHHMGKQLSGGEQQMLAIGRALSTNPKLLILDEATEGLAPVIRDEVLNCLSELKTTCQTIIVIDKYISELLKITDVFYHVNNGKLKFIEKNDLSGKSL